MDVNWNWPFTISLFANTSAAIMGTVFSVAVTWRLFTQWDRYLTPARLGMFALVTIGWFIVFRVGYWSPTMWLSDVGGTDRYHLGWIQYRWVSYGPAAILGLLGLMLGMMSLLLWKTRALALVLALSIAGGIAVAVTWQMSESGRWFDRTKVIEAHDKFWGYER